MDLLEAARERHSVRQYTGQKIEGEALEKLLAEIDRVNQESGLSIRLIQDEPKAFSGMMLKALVHFSGADSYLAIIGPESEHLNVDAGYWGEHLVLFAQTLGLNTCWAMMAGKKRSGELGPRQRNVILISIGYGENQGKEHSSKPISDFADVEDAPEWFVKGVECAMLAPTGMNKQGFRFRREGDRVTLMSGSSTLSQIDSGIVKYHFELGAGRENFTWSERS